MTTHDVCANRFDLRRFAGIEGLANDDLEYRGSRYADVRNALFANAYYVTWGAAEEPPLPVYAVTLNRLLPCLVPWRWRFRQAVRRILESPADLRWGSDRRGYRRILHPNAVCLLGTWTISANTRYSGYFEKGRKALIVARYSTCCEETRGGRSRSLSLVGKLFPTTDPDHDEPLRTANFITQQDIGGECTKSFRQAETTNAPNVTPWRRGLGTPTLLATALVFRLEDREPAMRQLYPIAELGKRAGEPTSAPEFMRLRVEGDRSGDGVPLIDFRDEILATMYDRGDPAPKRPLQFEIQVADKDKGVRTGLLVKRTTIAEGDWKTIGHIEFSEAVASYNGDFVLHFAHPPWRSDPNDPTTVVRRRS
jgi:hypothetical protein